MRTCSGASLPARSRKFDLEWAMITAVFCLRGEAVVEAAPDGTHVVCRLGGGPSDPWAKGTVPTSRAFTLWLIEHDGRRWLESRTEDGADPFTQDLARGFARRCARDWGTLFSDPETMNVFTFAAIKARPAEGG